MACFYYSYETDTDLQQKCWCPQKHDCIGYILELVLCKSMDLYLHEPHYVLADHRIHHSITGISAYIYTSNSSYPAGIVPSAVISYV